MKFRRWITPAILLLLFLSYSYFAFPIAQAREGGRQGNIVSMRQEKNTWVVLTQPDAGKWEALTVQKSLLFDRFRILDRYELDTPDFVSECNTALVCYSYRIENSSITIHDPRILPAFLIPRLLLLVFIWIFLDRLLDLIVKRYPQQKSGT